MEKLPEELIQKIFKYLDPEDLWRCLEVCQTWREVANSNYLWKKNCLKKGIDEVPLHPVQGFEDLCCWAQAFFSYYLVPLQNWRHEKSKSYYIPLDDPDLPITQIWEGNRGAVYTFKDDKLMIYEVYPHGIESSKLTPVLNGQSADIYSVSICINKDFVAVGNFNVVLIYKKVANNYVNFKTCYVLNDNMKICSLENDCLKHVYSQMFGLQAKGVFQDMLWVSSLYSDTYYVIDLTEEKVSEITESHFFESNYTLIALWDTNNINVYDFKGKKIFEKSGNFWGFAFNSEIIAVGTKETQSVETWLIKSGTKLMSKNVLYQTDIVFHPLKNVLVIVEKSRNCYRYSSYNAITGAVFWRVEPPLNESRCSGIKVISEYVFLWYVAESRPLYKIVDLKDGKVLRGGGLLPLSRPFLSETLWVYKQYDHFMLKSFITC